MASLPPNKSIKSLENASFAFPVRRLSQTTVATLTAHPPSPLVAPEHRMTSSGRASNVSPQPLQNPSSSPVPPLASSPNSRSSTPTLRTRSSLGSGQLPSPFPPIRRTSSNLAPSSNSYTMRKTPPLEDPQPPPMTAAHIARCFFQDDLKAHENTDDSQSTELAIVLHDACYGHRYARPRTSKANLSTIVERPERIRATIMGLSAAYVRLGERHADGLYPPQAQRQPGIPIPFTISKSSRQIPLTTPVVTNVHGVKWMQDLSTMCRDAESKLALNGKELVRLNSEESGEARSEKAKLHEGDLYLCSQSLEALEGSLGAVCDAIDQVFSRSAIKRTFVSIRPPGHHCSADYPSGFCWINNVHVGISHAAQVHGLTHAAIIDFDLHHGDGSQAITWAHNAASQRQPKNASAFKKASIGYFSLHDINSYPCEYGDEEKVQNASLCIENAHGQTIWNTHLQPWKKESEFWHLYETRYSVLIEKARAFLLHHSTKRRQSTSQPKAAIFISAGFDASEWEGSSMQRHKVNVPTAFYARFTRDIVDLANEGGLGVDGRVISVLEGGYSDRALSSGVLSHICGLASSKQLDQMNFEVNSLSHEIAKKLGNSKAEGTEDLAYVPTLTNSAPFESHWWSPQCLEDLENMGKATQPAMPVKKQPNGLIPTYTTPTQSSTAKVVSPLQPRRSMSSSTAASLQRPASSASSRLASPPALDIDWATAAQELCNLLVPTHRSTISHRHEELNAQATRVRKERQSILVSVVEAQTLEGKRMQLRDRKSKEPHHEDVQGQTASIMKSNRRKTMADATLLAKEPSEESSGFKPAVRVATRAPIRRRLSVASSINSTLEENPIALLGDLHRSADPGLGGKLTTGILGSQAQPLAGNGNELSIPKRSRPILNAKPAASRPKKSVIEQPPAVSRLPSSQTKYPLTKPSDHTLKSENGLSTGDPEAATSADLDSLVSGIKKINLKLNPPRKPDQEIPDKRKKVTTRAPRKLAAAKAANATVGQSDAVGVPSTAMPPVTISPSAHQVVEEASTSMDNTNRIATQAELQPLENANAQVPVHRQSPTVPLSSTPAFTAPTGPGILATASGPENALSLPSVVDPEPMAPPPPSIASSSIPLATLVNHQGASPKRTKAELPIFTSTSPIMFAPQKRDVGSLDETMRHFPAAEHPGDADAPVLGPRGTALPDLRTGTARQPSETYQ